MTFISFGAFSPADRAKSLQNVLQFSKAWIPDLFELSSYTSSFFLIFGVLRRAVLVCWIGVEGSSLEPGFRVPYSFSSEKQATVYPSGKAHWQRAGQLRSTHSWREHVSLSRKQADTELCLFLSGVSIIPLSRQTQVSSRSPRSPARKYV